MLQQVAMNVVLVVLCGLVVLAVLSLLRGFVRGARMRGPAGPYVPFEDVTPPAPVVRTRRLAGVAWAAVAWGAANLALAVALGFIGDVQVLREMNLLAIAAYVALGALMGGAGGVLLLAGSAAGRTLISWGHFLLGVLDFLGGVLSLLLPRSPRVTPEAAAAWPYLVAAFAVHLLATTVVGALAQTAGSPPDAPGAAAAHATREGGPEH